MMDERKPWERQKGEKNLWYDRFTQFRLMTKPRSLLAIYHQWQDKKGKKRSHSPAKSWRDACKDWQWRERAEAWDEHQRQEDEARWKERKRQQREDEWEAAGKLKERAEQMLKLPLIEATKTERESDEEGVRIVTTVVKPLKWSHRDLPVFYKTWMELARLAAEMETKRGSLDVTSKGEQIGGDYTDEQRRALVLDILASYGIEIDTADGG